MRSISTASTIHPRCRSRTAGTAAREDLGGQVVNCFMKCEADRTGKLRGRRQIMLDDSDVPWHRHAKAAVGGVAAAAIGDPAVFVSVDAITRGRRAADPHRRHRRRGMSVSVQTVPRSRWPTNHWRANRRANWHGSSAPRAVSPVEVLDAHLAVIAAINPTSTPSSRSPPTKRGTPRDRPNAPSSKGFNSWSAPRPAVASRTSRRPPASARLSRRRCSKTCAGRRRRSRSSPQAAGAMVLAKTNTPEFGCGANTTMRCSVRPAIRGIRL